MSRYYKATIEVLVEADNDGEACDAIAESLRPVLREFSACSDFLDWRYVDGGSGPTPHDGSGFEYVDDPINF